MKATRNTIFAIVSGLAMLSGAVKAQDTLRAPAEVPPAGYQGAQYVDSTGCIYIRAGAGSSVTWVPRVTRDRKPVCGFKPSLAASTQAEESAPQAVVDLSALPPTTQASSQLADVNPNARILPPHLYERRQMLSSVRVPKGYEPVWNDDRLNPRRAEQTRAGQEQMSRFWTNTVPRRAREER